MRVGGVDRSRADRRHALERRPRRRWRLLRRAYDGSMTTRVAIVGGTGKLGGIIRDVIDGDDDFEVVATLSSALRALRAGRRRPRRRRLDPGRLDRCRAGGRSNAASTSWSARPDGRRSASRWCGRSWMPRARARCSSRTSRSDRCSARRSPPPRRRSSRRSRSSRRIARRRSTRPAAPRCAPPSSSRRRAPTVGPVESPHVDQRARGQQVASVPIHSLRRPGVVARQEVDARRAPGSRSRSPTTRSSPRSGVCPRHPRRARGRARCPRRDRRPGQLPRHRHPRCRDRRRERTVAEGGVPGQVARATGA